MKLRLVLALVGLATIALSAGNSSAQLVPRLVLVEEGTNSSCGPCAADNPGVEQFLQSHAGNVVHIAYHPNWPGATDPMYLNDQTDNMGRVVSYYAINGVPSVAIDGGNGTTFVPGSPSLLESPYEARVAKLSPLVMTVSRTVVDTTVTVTVGIRAVGDLSSYTKTMLRVAAVESSYDHPGPNGEKSYIHPMRQMMPDYKGTAISMKLGDTATYTFTYPLKAAYIASHMYEVAFVQSDAASHEVLQAGTSYPLQLTVDAGSQLVQRMSSPVPPSLTLHNLGGTAMSYVVSFVPTSPDLWPLTLNGQSLAAPITVTADPGANVALKVTAQEGTGLYCSGNLVVKTKDGALMTSSPIKFIAPDARLAFYDVSGDTTIANYTMKSLGDLQEKFVPMSAADMASLDSWKPSEFSEILINGGKEIVAGGDKANVQNYMKLGGHVLMHGGEIAFGLADPASDPTDIDTAFLHTVFHANYIRDIDGAHFVTGNPGDTLGMAFTTNMQMDSGTVEANQPDLIQPINGAVSVMFYGGDASQAAGIRWDDATGRAVYYSFGLENLTVRDRDNIIKASLQWLRGQSVTAAAPSAPVLATSLAPAYPNPLSMRTVVPFTLANADEARLSLIDTRGRELEVLASEFMAAGAHSVKIDGSALPNGTYFVVLRTSAGIQRQAITIEH